MSKVLFIKANDRPIEQAVSVKLYHAFLEAYKTNHPEDEIIELDLHSSELPYLNSTMINAIYKANNGIEQDAEEQRLSAIANKYLDQFLAADKYVFAFPLWNLTVPAVLHTYIDYLNQAGKTFRYTAEGPIGLLGDKKATILNARGGNYSEGMMAEIETSVRFVSSILAFFGVPDVKTVIVEGHNAEPARADEIVSNGLEQARELAASF